MLTLGTAGQIDHGKSSLLKVLTSIDPDRLPEEKRRGMTIDLGFVWLKVLSGEMVGIVDVPGHKQFVHNVIPGLSGIDAALLVVAADDGWMPQTEEHVQILDLLGVRNAVVALTKVDLIDDPGWLDMVETDIGERLAQTSLRNASIIRVSSKDGNGIKELKGAIDQLALKIAPRKDIGKPRLPIDRVFTMKGSGVVVTGTLINGSLSSGDEVIISPSGIGAHIRVIESYKQQVARAQPGSRVALNLAGVKKDDLKRGDIVLATDRQNRTSRIVDVEIRLIPHESLKNNTELVVYLETSELLAKVLLIGSKVVQSTMPVFAQLRFDQDISPHIGEHFILRRQSPAVTIGGGTILDPFAAKYKLKDTDRAIAFLKGRRGLGLEELVLSEVAKHKYIEREELLFASCYSQAEIAAFAARFLDEGRLVAAGSYVVDSGYWQGQSRKILDILHREHLANPLRKGLPQAVVQSYLDLPREIFNRLTQTLVDSGQLIREGDTVALTSHKPSLTQEQEVIVARMLELFAKNRASPPTAKELAAQIPGSEDIIRFMCQQNMLIEFADGVLFEREHYEKIRSETIKFLEKKGQITIQDMHSLFGFSRKYTIPILAQLDKEGVTRREGDVRVLAKR